MKPKTEPEKKIETSEQADNEEFARFDALVKKVMSVPKKEIDAKAEEYEQKKAAKKTTAKPS